MASEARNDKRFIQIGLKIAYYRKLNELSQEQLADQIGVNPKYLSRVETPSVAQPISLKTLFAVADALRISPAKLMDFDE